MIIVCNSCSTQYSVNDAKVRGKLVRITCKHCASAIVVDGRQMSSEVSVAVASQKPLASYALPRRDESVVAHAPVPSVAPSRPHAPAPAPVPTAMSDSLREEDRTMVARSRFVDEMSVHDERTVIGQIPKEALEFERMFAQRTQPPPPDSPKSQPNAAKAVAPAPSSANLPSFADKPSEPPAAQEPPDSQPPPDSQERAEAQGPPDSQPPPERPEEAKRADEDEDATANVPVHPLSLSEPPTLGTLARKSSSDVRGLVSLAEATHPSVARSVSARRLRVTLVTLLVLAVLVLLFVIQMPR